MELEEAIKNCKQFIDENKDRPIILHKSIDIVLKELDNRIPKEKIANTLRRVQDYDLTYKDIALFNIINQELLGNEKWEDKE